MPLILLIVLTLGIIINGSWIIKSSIQWFKKRGIIDHNLKMKVESTLKKPIYKTRNEGDKSKWYPKLQYGQHKRDNIINRIIKI